MLFLLQLVLLGCVIAACAYYLTACAAVWQWHVGACRQRTLPSFTPPVTIFKPVRGAELEAYENFASFCRLDYPSYQLVFGVQDANDAVIPIIERLRADFPHCDITLIVNATQHGYNGKVSNLLNMQSAALHDLWLIADSDIRIKPDYLRRVVAPLQDAQVGMVTCLYRGVRAKTFGDLLENLGVAALFAPEVCMARMLQGVKFALGATMVLRRETLESIGGFAAIADHLADDYELGHAVAERLKLKVVLSECVVDHVANAASFGAMFKHQLRWMRAIRVSRPAGYAGLIVTYGTVTASLLLAVSGFHQWAWWLWGVTLSLRMSAAFSAGWVVLRDRTSVKWFGLIPLRDVMACVVWLCGFLGSEINWRGTRLRISTDGKLAPLKK